MRARVHALFNGDAQYDLLGNQIEKFHIVQPQALQNLLARFMRLQKQTYQGRCIRCAPLFLETVCMRVDLALLPYHAFLEVQTQATPPHQWNGWTTSCMVHGMLS